MTTVILYRSNNHYLGFEFSEHARLAADDYDGALVCSALSITSISAVNAIDLLTDAVPTYQVDEQKGYLKCMLPADLSAETLEKTDLIIAHLSIAVMALIEEYPHNVQLFTKEVESYA